jgi:ankyrin repeat protein
VRQIILPILFTVLLQADNTNGWTDLLQAIYDGNMTNVEKLIDSEIDIETKSKAGISPLHMAVKLRQFEIVKMLIEHKIDINTEDGNGLSPLHYAIGQNRVKIARYLIVHGADMDQKNNYGATPLHQAAYTGNSEMVQFMLDNGAKADIKNNNGSTASQVAFAKRNFGVANLLSANSGLPCGEQTNQLKDKE